MLEQKITLTKGILIAIEGIDGAGKTTQVKKLKNHFSKYGFPVSTFKEPTDGVFGREIKKLAIYGRHTVTADQELELFLQDRIEDCEYNILPALNNKHLVIIDRYYFSSIAYQGTLGIDPNYIKQRNELIAPIPDLVVVLDLSPHLGLSRISNLRKEKHNHFEKENYLDQVRHIFKGLDESYLQSIDGSRSEESVFNNLKNIVKDILIPFSEFDTKQLAAFTDLDLTNKIDMELIFD